MELQQAFDPKRLAVSVLPHSIVYSLNVYGRICSRAIVKGTVQCACGLALSFGLTVCVWSLFAFAFVSCVCVAICFFGCFFRSGALHAAAARVSWKMLSRETLTHPGREHFDVL